MLEKLFYPCVIREEDGWHYVNFPDFEACFTDGETLEEALYYAKDVLIAVLVDLASQGKDFPKASKPQGLTDMAVEKNINFSQTLEEALEVK